MVAAILWGLQVFPELSAAAGKKQPNIIQENLTLLHPILSIGRGWLLPQHPGI